MDSGLNPAWWYALAAALFLAGIGLIFVNTVVGWVFRRFGDNSKYNRLEVGGCLSSPTCPKSVFPQANHPKGEAHPHEQMVRSVCGRDPDSSAVRFGPLSSPLCAQHLYADDSHYCGGFTIVQYRADRT
jgi:hypothetical protein